MSDKPAYLETWRFYSYEGPRNAPGPTKHFHGASVCTTLAGETNDQEHECIATAFSAHADFEAGEKQASERAALAASAPAMARALLAVEFSITGMYRGICPACGPGRSHSSDGLRHTPSCALDQALIAAGFPDQASRDEARRNIVAGVAKR